MRAVIPLLGLCVLALTGCMAQLTVTGTGTVTVTSDTPATTYNGVNTGSVARLCAPELATCRQEDDFIYTYYPAGGETEWIVSPGFPVINRSGATIGLPAGRYTLQVTEYASGARDTVDPVQIHVFSTSAPDLTVWQQSYGRADSGGSCGSGWQPGWAQWPGDGAGGFVCNREIYAYYPDLPVPTPGAAAGGAPWLQSVARSSAQAPCPDGYVPGWAQWPNDGQGGEVCNRTLT